MNFDDQLRRFFGTEDLDILSPAALAGEVEKARDRSSLRLYLSDYGRH